MKVKKQVLERTSNRWKQEDLCMEVVFGWNFPDIAVTQLK